MLYATLTQTRNYLGLTDSQTKDDERLLFFLRGASTFIENIRRCDVRREVRRLDCPRAEYQRSIGGMVSVANWVTAFNQFNEVAAGRLRLDDDCLEVISVTNGDGALIASTNYVMQPANVYPKASLRLTPSSGVSWLPSSLGNYSQVIAVEAWWGWHPRYAEAFVDSLDTVEDNPLTAQATSLTVNDADGVAGDLLPDRFQAGTMIRIEDELCYVLSRNATSNVLTVSRGFNGTLAVSHLKDTPIQLYRFPTNIELAAVRLAAWRYRQKDSNTFDKTTILATGEQIVPSSIPPDVYGLLPNPRPTFKDETA